MNGREIPAKKGVPTVLPEGVELVHPYGKRTVHRVDPADRGPTIRGAMTKCGKHKISAIDDVRVAGDVTPSKWDRWALCPACFAD